MSGISTADQVASILAGNVPSIGHTGELFPVPRVRKFQATIDAKHKLRIGSLEVYWSASTGKLHIRRLAVPGESITVQLMSIEAHVTALRVGSELPLPEVVPMDRTPIYFGGNEGEADTESDSSNRQSSIVNRQLPLVRTGPGGDFVHDWPQNANTYTIGSQGVEASRT